MSSSASILLGVSILSLGAAALSATPATAQTTASTTVVSHPADDAPQRATVNISQVSFHAVYTGAPQFRAITGTSMAYAVNTRTPVIRVGTAYYAVESGVWFVAASPSGPWAVAVTVPTVIYTIPASSPVHYVTYVQVYGSGNGVVYVGYTSGYYNAVVATGGVVAGNVYGRWGSAVAVGRGAAWADPVSGNYGRAGEGAFYNEATGARGYGYGGRSTNAYTGETRAAAGGAAYNPQTGRAVAGEAQAVGNIYTGEGAVAGHSASVNTNTGQVGRSAGAAGRTSEGAGAAGAFETTGPNGNASGAGYATYDRSTGEVSRGGVAEVNGNVYAARDGQVYKQTDSGWEQAQRRSQSGAARQRPSGGVTRPSGGGAIRR